MEIVKGWVESTAMVTEDGFWYFDKSDAKWRDISRDRGTFENLTYIRPQYEASLYKHLDPNECEVFVYDGVPPRDMEGAKYVATNGDTYKSQTKWHELPGFSAWETYGKDWLLTYPIGTQARWTEERAKEEAMPLHKHALDYVETIDQAEALQKQLDKLRSGLIAVETNVKNVDQSTTTYVDDHIKAVNENLESLTKKITSVDAGAVKYTDVRIATIEKRLRELTISYDNALEGVDERIEDLDTSFEKLEERLNNLEQLTEGKKETTMTDKNKFGNRALEHAKNALVIGGSVYAGMEGVDQLQNALELMIGVGENRKGILGWLGIKNDNSARAYLAFKETEFFGVLTGDHVIRMALAGIISSTAIAMTEENEDGTITSTMKLIPDLLAELGVHVSDGALAGEFAMTLRTVAKKVKPAARKVFEDVRTPLVEGVNDENRERIVKAVAGLAQTERKM